MIFVTIDFRFFVNLLVSFLVAYLYFFIQSSTADVVDSPIGGIRWQATKTLIFLEQLEAMVDIFPYP